LYFPISAALSRHVFLTFAKTIKTVLPKCKRSYLILSEISLSYGRGKKMSPAATITRVHTLTGRECEKVLIPPWLPAAHYISMNLLSRRETRLFAGHVLPDVFQARKLICPGDYAPHFIMCPVCSPAGP